MILTSHKCRYDSFGACEYSGDLLHLAVSRFPACPEGVDLQNIDLVFVYPRPGAVGEPPQRGSDTKGNARQFEFHSLKCIRSDILRRFFPTSTASDTIPYHMMRAFICSYPIRASVILARTGPKRNSFADPQISPCKNRTIQTAPQKLLVR
jgi:hypothetical protein